MNKGLIAGCALMIINWLNPVATVQAEQLQLLEYVCVDQQEQLFWPDRCDEPYLLINGNKYSPEPAYEFCTGDTHPFRYAPIPFSGAIRVQAMEIDTWPDPDDKIGRPWTVTAGEPKNQTLYMNFQTPSGNTHYKVSYQVLP